MGRKQIIRLLDEGATLLKFPLKIHYLQGQEQGPASLVVSVPKRNFKRAVKRNLLKRRIREAVRHNVGLLGERPPDLMIIYVSKELQSYETISSSVVSAFKKIAGVSAGKAH